MDVTLGNSPQHLVGWAWHYLDVDRPQEATMAVQDELDLWPAELRPALHIGRSTRVPTDAIARLIANLRGAESVAAGS